MRYEPGRCLLRRILRDHKLSQRELAVLVDMPETQISDYINGRTTMGYATAVTIAKILEIHAEELYDWIECDKLGE